MPVFQIDQPTAGIPPGTPGEAREDISGEDAGGGVGYPIEITITDPVVGATDVVRIADEPEGANSSIVEITPTLWQITFSAPVYGPFRIELERTLPDAAVEKVRRIASIASPNYALHYPALGERGDPDASLFNNGPGVALVTERNVGGSVRGYHPFYRRTVEQLEGVIGAAGTLEFWIDTDDPGGAGSGTQADPWGGNEGMEALWSELRKYVRIDRCEVHIMGSGSLPRQAQPFDGAPFGSTGSLIFIGEDFVELASVTVGTGSDVTQAVLDSDYGTAALGNASLEGITGANAGTRRRIRGYQRKRPVDAAATVSLTLSGAQTVDDVALVDGNRCLAPVQATASEIGIYIVRTGAWERARDADSIAEVTAASVSVSGGTVNGGSTFYQSSVSFSTQSWTTVDRVVVPSYEWPSSPQAGDTFRVVEPAATLELPGGAAQASTIAFCDGFYSGTQEDTLAFATGEYPPGITLINLAVNSSVFAVLGCDRSTVSIWGVDFIGQVRFRAPSGTMMSGTASYSGLTGTASFNTWRGWGFRHVQNFNNDIGAKLFGHVILENGLFANSEQPFYVELEGGRIGGSGGGQGIVEMRIVREASFVITSSRVPVLFDRSRISTTGPSVKMNALFSTGGTLFSWIEGAPAVHVFAPGQAKLISGVSGHSTDVGVDCLSGGRCQLENGNPNLTGDVADWRVQSNQGLWTDYEFSGTGQGVGDFSEPYVTGAYIYRIPGVVGVRGGRRTVVQSFAFAATPTLDLRIGNDWALSDVATGDMAVTLTNGVDGWKGSILGQQDAVGGRVITVVASGRTVVVKGTVPSGPNDVFELRYHYVTIASTAYVIVGAL